MSSDGSGSSRNGGPACWSAWASSAQGSPWVRPWPCWSRPRRGASCAKTSRTAWGRCGCPAWTRARRPRSRAKTVVRRRPGGPSLGTRRDLRHRRLLAAQPVRGRDDRGRGRTWAGAPSGERRGLLGVLEPLLDGGRLLEVCLEPRDLASLPLELTLELGDLRVHGRDPLVRGLLPPR